MKNNVLAIWIALFLLTLVTATGLKWRYRLGQTCEMQYAVGSVKGDEYGLIRLYFRVVLGSEGYDKHYWRIVCLCAGFGEPIYTWGTVGVAEEDRP